MKQTRILTALRKFWGKKEKKGLNNKIEWKDVTPSAYDGSTLNHYQEDTDWRGVVVEPKSKDDKK